MAGPSGFRATGRNQRRVWLFCSVRPCCLAGPSTPAFLIQNCAQSASHAALSTAVSFILIGLRSAGNRPEQAALTWHCFGHCGNFGGGTRFFRADSGTQSSRQQPSVFLRWPWALRWPKPSRSPSDPPCSASQACWLRRWAPPAASACSGEMVMLLSSAILTRVAFHTAAGFLVLGIGLAGPGLGHDSTWAE